MKLGTQAAPSVAIIGTRGYPSFYGGFETAVRRLAPYLADDGWSVRVYGRPGAQSSADVERDPRIKTIVTKGVESKSLSTLTFGLTAVLHALRHKPDVALIMNVANGYWLPLLKLRGIPTVVNVDGIEWQRAKWGRVGRAVFWLGARFTAWFADELIFDANAIGDYWRRVFGRSGTYIPYGGDSPSLTSQTPEFQPGTYALAVARFVPENSIHLILDAAIEITQEFDLDVVLVGSAPEGDALAEKVLKISKNPRIHALGHVADDQRLFCLWRGAAIYIHGHTVGGTNPALVQAMSLGAPIAAKDTVYNREVLADCGTFFGDERTLLIEGMRECLDDSETFKARALQRAREFYSWDQVCSRYENVLSSTIKRLRS